MHLTGGNGAPAAISCFAPLSITSNGLTLEGGTGAGGYALIESFFYDVSIDGTGDIILTGGTANQTSASIIADSFVSGNVVHVNIGQTTPPANLTLQGGSGDRSYATISTDSTISVISSNCKVTSTISGDYLFQAGTGAVDSRAGFYTGLSLHSPGDITLTGGGYSLTGGATGAGYNSAEVLAPSLGGIITLTSNGSPVVLQGGGAPISDARIVPLATGNLQINTIGSFSASGGSGLSSRAIVATDKGGNITVTGTGDYAMTGGSSSGDSRAGFYTGLTSGSGDITLTGGGYSLTGGATGAGYNSAEILAPSLGGIITLTSNDRPVVLQGGGAPISDARIVPLATGNLQIKTISSFSASGGSGLSSRAIVATDKGGSITVTGTGDYAMTGGSSSGDSRAGFYTGLTSGSGDITLTGGGYSLTGGATGAGYNSAEILAPSLGGIITLTSNGSPVVLQGGGAPISDARIVPLATGNLQIKTISSFSATGGSGLSSRAIVATDKGGSITVTGTGDYAMTGGSSSGDSRAGFYTGLTSGSGDITLTGGGYSLTGGATGAGYNSAEILASSLGGIITLTSNDRPVVLQGGASPISDARIVPLATGNLQINTISSFSATGGSGLSSRAIVATDKGGSITVTGTGDYAITGGSSSTDSRAGFYTGLTSGSGSITLTGLGYRLTGGATGAGSNFAEIASGAGGGAISLTSNNGDVTLQGGGGTNANASIVANGAGAVTIAKAGAISLLGSMTAGGTDAYAAITTTNGNIGIDGQGLMELQGGSQSGTYAQILTGAVGNTITIGNTNQPSGLTMQGGSGAGVCRAIIATNLGGAIISTITGDYAMTGGISANDSRAGFYTGLTSGSGSITLTGGGYSLTGGATGAGYNSAEILAPSLGGIITLTSNGSPVVLQGGASPISDARIVSLSLGDLQIKNISSFSASGGSGLSSRAIVATDKGGNITVTGTGNYAITGGRSSGDSRAGFYTGLTSGSGSITLTGLGYGLTGGATGAGSNFAEISSGAGGGAISLTSNNGAVTLQGGGGTNANASIVANGAGDVTIANAGAISLIGSMTAGGTDAYAAITTTNGNIGIDGQGLMKLQGGAQSGTYAQILTGTAGNMITIGNTNQPSGLMMQGGSGAGVCNAIIATNTGGNILCSITGGYSLTGGISSGDSRAGFYTGLASGSGDITLSGDGNFSLNGGSGANSNAEVNVQGAISAYIGNGNYALTGGSGAVSLAQFTATGGVSLYGYDLILLPGSGSDAVIESTGDNTSIALKINNDVSLSGNNTSSRSSFIRTTATSGVNPIALSCKTLEITGGSASNSSAQIETVLGAIKILAVGDIQITGGSASGANALIHSTTTGSIALAANNLNVLGGASSTNTGIQTQSGNIAAACAGNCTYNAPNLTGLAFMQTLGSNLLLVVHGSTNLAGNTVFSVPDPGNLALISGQNISIGDLLGSNTQVEVIGGTSASSLTLVVDEDFPVPPGFGSGSFTLYNGATLSASNIATPVRIFTSQRSLNMIGTTINGVAFVPGPELVDSPTEQWGVYFPSLFYGGTGFTLFYKHGDITPPPTPPPVVTVAIGPILQRAAFVDSEMLFDLSDMDTFAFEDRWYFSTFEDCLESCGLDRDAEFGMEDPTNVLTSYDVVDDKGLAIRRRKLLGQKYVHYNGD